MAKYPPMPPGFFNVLARWGTSEALVSAALPKSLNIDTWGVPGAPDAPKFDIVYRGPGPSSEVLSRELNECTRAFVDTLRRCLDLWCAAFIVVYNEPPRLCCFGDHRRYRLESTGERLPWDWPHNRAARKAAAKLFEQIRMFPDYFEFRVEMKGTTVHYGWYPLQDKLPHGRTHE